MSGHDGLRDRLFDFLMGLYPRIVFATGAVSLIGAILGICKVPDWLWMTLLIGGLGLLIVYGVTVLCLTGTVHKRIDSMRKEDLGKI